MSGEPDPPVGVTDPTDSDDACPRCGAIHGGQPQPAPPQVQAWTCTACGLHWAITVVNPAPSLLGALLTPQLRTTALLAVLRADVARRSGKEPITMTTTTVCLPATEVISVHAMASVDTVEWCCRLCDHHSTATTRPTAHADGVEHLTAEHHTTIGAP